MSNCQVGDIAIFVRSRAGNIGRLVHIDAASDEVGVWRITTLSRANASPAGIPFGQSHVFQKVPAGVHGRARDADLRPIRGGDDPLPVETFVPEAETAS